ncbi:MULTISPECIES: DNA (cytosine-5-)-methyltransferase [unclassified Anoxybacillus]|uniref:DNA (cytosine-5-)-methyltransferase n=1 Tax=unclassified Anoxybacillus TaxID=2639704 RepID=UPI001EDAD234|nr:MULTISPECIES: DNA (cytosine-5-)-methyltransferase [unclassified Anoxybacillus]MCG3083915.1 DNA (cytosine-5-)-methyltransferase [Anoxybacillus sp. LAT27]
MYSISKEKVRKYMTKSGISTQKELAEKMGISKNQLSMLLSPNFNPIKSNALKLCHTLGVEIEDIIYSEQLELDLGYIDTKTDVETENTVNVFHYEGSHSVEVRDIVADKQYTAVELFAGAGGLALGLEMAGFHSLGLVEIDKYACQTLRKNRPHWNVIEKDIIEVAEHGIKNFINNCPNDIDLLSGGYPCQAFSYAGKKLGLNDARGTLFYYYAKILQELQPKMFLAENVKGLVNHDNGKTLATMLSVFEEIGYNVQWKVLNALDYDVAQKRERIFIIGIRKDLVEKYSVSYRFPKPYGYTLTLRDVLQDVPPSEGAKYPEEKRKVLELVPPGGYWRDLPEEIAKQYMGKSYYSGGGRTGMARRLSWDEPCLTLTCSPAQKQTERCHPEETRPFTVREYARIQSFPDDWVFDCSMNNAYKQIGNAVPVHMAKAVGLSIVKVLNEMNKKGNI